MKLKIIFILIDNNLNSYHNNNKHTTNFTLNITLTIKTKQQTQLILHYFTLININHYYYNNIQYLF